MKRFIYTIFASCLLFASCSENDNMYDGGQYFALGRSQVYNFTTDETDSLYQIPFGLAYPATKDYMFDVEIIKTDLTEDSKKLTEINDKVEGALKLRIPRGSNIGYLNIKAFYSKFSTGVDKSFKLKIIDNGTLDCTITNNEVNVIIQKFCSLDQDKMKAWEGVYVDYYDPYYYMNVKHLEGDTLLVEKFGGLPASLNPQPIKIVFDYSTRPYRVETVNNVFYTTVSGGTVEIYNQSGSGPLKPESYVDFCSKIIDFRYTFKVNGVLYNQKYPSHLVRVGDLP